MGRLRSSLPPRLTATAPRLVSSGKLADPFYQSAEWRQLVREVKAERGAFCQRCGSAKGLIADHIVERRDGGADLDKSNIELLCARHHGAKTQAARQRRAQRLA